MTKTPKTKPKTQPSRANQPRAPEAQRKHPRVGLILAVVVTVIVVASIGVFFVFPLPWTLPTPQPWAVLAGVGLLLLGFIILTNAFQALGVARAFGEELYASKKESQLITVGLYAYTRNPIYLGLIILFFGWFLVTLLTFLLVVTILLIFLFYFVAKWEERELAERFGQQFEEYQRAVPFFVPHRRLRRHRAKKAAASKKQRAFPSASKKPRVTTKHRRTG